MIDLSQRYVKMCTAAVELQRVWQPAVFDYVFCRVDQSIGRILPNEPKVRGTQHHMTDSGYFPGAECFGFKVEHIWLPAAEQVQDLLGISRGRHFVDANKRFLVFAAHKKSATFWQVWLRYYMATRARKSWDARAGRWEYSLKVTHGKR
jgi:hypothetical protein